MTTEITKISIRVGNRESDLTIDEARELYEKLKEIFDRKAFPPNPTRPADPWIFPPYDKPWKKGDYWWVDGTKRYGPISVYCA